MSRAFRAEWDDVDATDLRDLRADLAQSYLFGRPQPASALTPVLTDYRIATPATATAAGEDLPATGDASRGQRS